MDCVLCVCGACRTPGVPLRPPLSQDRRHQSWSSLNGRLAAINRPDCRELFPAEEFSVRREAWKLNPADTNTVGPPSQILNTLHRNRSVFILSVDERGAATLLDQPPVVWDEKREDEIHEISCKPVSGCMKTKPYEFPSVVERKNPVSVCPEPLKYSLM